MWPVYLYVMSYQCLRGTVSAVLGILQGSLSSCDGRAGAEGFHMPQGDDEQRMSKGYAFVELNTPEVGTQL